MISPLLQTSLIIAVGIVLIVYLTTRLKLHAFFALVGAAVVVGLGFRLPFSEILQTIKGGFGDIIGSLGLIIIFGITLGLLLEKTGATWTLARAITRIVGKNRIPEAMNMTGWVVGMPIFCDSGYIVLSSLNNFLTRQSKSSIAMMATALGTGLYAVHNMIPPHPGPASAVVTLGVDFGSVILYGLIVAIPTAFCGLLWAKFSSRRFVSGLGYAKGALVAERNTTLNEASRPLPPLFLSVLPVLVPIALIGIGAFIHLEDTASVWLQLLSFMGIPEVALWVGIVLALLNHRERGAEFRNVFSEAVEKSGDILLIIGAGGAFGAIISTANLAELISGVEGVESVGLFLPFLIAAILKTAQGSSTVAIIATATIIVPLLPSLHLDSEMGRIFSVLAIGAGSIMVSHANDSYFWVISKFSKVSMQAMLRVYSAATALMGLVAFAIVELLYSILH